MGKVTEAIQDLFPGLPAVRMYDDEFPDHVAGHPESASYYDETDVMTPHGVDVGFDGDSVAHREGSKGGEEVGDEATNRRIHETVHKSIDADDRTAVTAVARGAIYGNETLVDAFPRRILLPNRNRKQVTITNQGASLMAVGKSGNIAVTGGVPSASAAYLPSAAGVLSQRVFTHRQEIWVVGAAGGIVDWVEENF